MLECAGSRNCGGRQLPALPAQPLNVNANQQFVEPQALQRFEQKLLDFQQRLDVGLGSLAGGLQTIYDLNNKVHSLGKRSNQDLVLPSSLQNISDIDIKIEALTQRLQEQDQSLRLLIDQLFEALTQRLRSQDQSLRGLINDRFAPSDDQKEDSATLKKLSPLPRKDIESVSLLRKPRQDPAPVWYSSGPRTPAIFGQECTDVDMKGLHQEQTHLLQRVVVAEQTTLSLKEEFQSVLAKGLEYDTFRRTVLDDVHFEVERQLSTIQGTIKQDHFELESGKGAEASEFDAAGSNVLVKSRITIVEGDKEIELQGSLWDASILIAWPHLPIFPNIVIVVLVAINIIGQVMFCIIIEAQFIQPGLPDNDRMVYWREIAHAEDQLDPITGASLITRVCQQDGSLQVADSQVGVVQNAQQYQQEVCLLSWPCMKTGPTTFILAWLLWALIAVDDAIANAHLLRGVLNIPRGPRTQVVFARDGLQITSIFWGRVFMMCCICAIRFAVCVSLFLFGSMWIGNTVNVQNIVLNASALGFVLDMDGLIFDVFIPPVVKSTLEALKSLRAPSPGSPGTASHFLFYNIGLRPLLSLSWILATFVWIWTQEITDVDAQLTQLNTTLCAGHTDFSWTFKKDFELLLAKASTPYVQDLHNLPNDQKYRMDAVKQLWTRTVDPESPAGEKIMWEAWLTPNEPEYQLFTTVPIGDLTYSHAVGNPDCESSGFTWEKMRLDVYSIRGLQKSAQNFTALGCDDVALACGKESGTNLRLFCPTQCGCGHPRSGLFMAGPDKGCPRDKCVQSVAYITEMARIDCTDPSVDELNSLPGWARYWNEFEEIQVTHLGGLFRVTTWNGLLDAKSFAALAREHGCAALRGRSSVGHFCIETASTSSVAPFCPVTCGCRMKRNLPGCPSTCEIYDSAYEKSLGEVPCRDIAQGELTQAGSSFNLWSVGAEARYEHWHYNAVVSERFLPANLRGLNASSVWNLANIYGCHGLGTWICSERLGAFNMFTICSNYCQCGTGTSKYCPKQCSTAVFRNAAP